MYLLWNPKKDLQVSREWKRGASLEDSGEDKRVGIDLSQHDVCQ